MTVFLLLMFLFLLRYSETINKEIYEELNVNDILPILRNIPLYKPRSRSARKLDNSTLNVRTINYGTLTSNSRVLRTLNYTDLKNRTPNSRTVKHRMTNSRNLSEWLENVVPIPKKSKNFRRSRIEGLMHFKTRVNKNKLKKPKHIINDDIIPNNKYELENTLANLGDTLPNFNENFADLISRRFNKIHFEYLRRTAEEIPAPSNLSVSMRRLFSDDLTVPGDKRVMSRVVALMTQFIHEAQQKMILSQILREKYMPTVKFKIGYLFALLRILKQQQLRIYSSMHFYRFYTPDKLKYDTSVMGLMYYFNLYEKLVRLDDDIVTSVRYLWQLEEERKKEQAVDATRFPKRTKMTTPGKTVIYYARKGK